MIIESKDYSIESLKNFIRESYVIDKMGYTDAETFKEVHLGDVVLEFSSFGRAKCFPKEDVHHSFVLEVLQLININK